MRAAVQNVLPDDPVAAAAVIIALGAMATILGAWFFQYVLQYPPCPLCLEQRTPYYLSIPLAALIALGASVGSSRRLLAFALGVIAVAMIYNTGLGIYHAGVEWKWWAGPQSCSGAFNALNAASNLLERVQSAHIVRCDEAAWRFLGLSLAGWNVLISAALALVAAWGVRSAWRQGSSSLSQ